MHARILAAVSSALLLAACGGSSSKPPPPAGPSIAYSGPTASASLTASTDKNALVSGAALLAQGFSGFADGAAALAGGFAASAGVVSATAAAQPAFVKEALALAADARHRGAPGLATASGVSLTVTAPCHVSGSMAVSMLDADGVPTMVTAGDYVQISFASCDNGEGTVAHGSFRLTFDTTVADDFVTDVTSMTKDATFALTLAFHDFWSSNADGSWSGINGNQTVTFVASLSQQKLEYQVSGTSIEGASGVGDAVKEAFRIAALPGGDGKYHNLARELYTGMGTPSATPTEGQWDLDARVCTLEWKGCLNVETNPTFAQHEGALYPYAGALEVSDDAAHFVQVAATSEDGSATLTWNLGAASSGTLSTTWGCLDGTAACN